MSIQQESLRVIAHVLDTHLSDIYGCKMGFMLVVGKQDEESGTADYVSNSRREDCIKWLRETADRLEQNQDIPATQGEA